MHITIEMDRGAGWEVRQIGESSAHTPAELLALLPSYCVAYPHRLWISGELIATARRTRNGRVVVTRHTPADSMKVGTPCVAASATGTETPCRIARPTLKRNGYTLHNPGETARMGYVLVQWADSHGGFSHVHTSQLRPTQNKES
jgi:hypothetical protein